MLRVQLAAADVVGRVLAGRSLDAELRAVGAQDRTLEPQERAALQDLAYGTLRFLGEIDSVLTLLLHRSLKDEHLRHLLRVAIYQLAHTRAAAHAVVDHAVQACAAIGQPGARGLVNAILRNLLRRRESLLAEARAHPVGRYSHPQWWVEKLRRQYPAQYAQILDHANTRPPLTLRINERATAIGRYLARLEASTIEGRALGGTAVVLVRPVPIERVPGFAEGEVSVQDAAAQYAAIALDAPAGARVLDACAAPGGKTAHILERADVELVALDCDAARLDRVRSNLVRLKLRADLTCGDAADPSAWWDGRAYTHIIADVPCSASGVVRRHPDIKWLRRRDDIARFAQRQHTIVESLWRLLAPGGKFLYSTCSVFDEENQSQIDGFLERHADAQRLPLPAPQTQAQQLAGQILPDENHDGFFYALLQKS